MNSSETPIFSPTPGVATPGVAAAAVTSAPGAVVSAPAAPRRWPGRLAVGLTTLYSVALLVVVGAFRFVGEAWWLTTAALYFPRIVFALPLPLVAIVLLLFGSWRQILLLLPVPILLLLFPLMGLSLGTGSTLKAAQAADGRPALRVLSFNVAAGDHAQASAATVMGAKADLILLQEWDARVAELLTPALPHFHKSVDGQFGILSRYPIIDVYLPSTVPYLEKNDRAARFARYRITTPMGLLTVLNVHPVSPRKGLEKFRRIDDVRARLRKGALGGDEGVATLQRNAAMRWEQVQAIVAEAARASGPVIIAGDTNLPGLSRIYAQTLSTFRDGFSEVGRGFGYTYPAQQPWMRIDRILVSPALSFSRFEVLPASGSDHLAVTADLQLR